MADIFSDMKTTAGLPVRDLSLPPSEGGSRAEYDFVTSYGQLERVTIDVGMYEGGNIRVSMESFDEDMGARVGFPDATVDARKALPPLTAAVDVKSNGAEVMEFLVEEGFGEPTGECLAVGDRSYPMLKFDEGKLAQADPRGFERYCRAIGIEPGRREPGAEPLDRLKSRAAGRAPERNADVSRRKPGRSRDMGL